jgi:glycosyltransferase involved in cell wall biosynthesis
VRIVYLNTLYPPHVRGGAELLVQAQAEAMVARGHAVSVLTIGDQPHPRRREESINGVHVVRTGFANRYFHGPGRAPATLTRLAWHWRDRRNRRMQAAARAELARLAPEVVCLHNLAGWSVAVWEAAAGLGLPMLQVLHDQYLLCPTAMMFRDGRSCAHRCLVCRALRLGHARASRQLHAVVGVSRFVLERLLAAGMFGGVPILEVLHNASSRALPPPREAVRAIEGAAPALRFGYIGTLAPCKGIEPLLQAFAALPSSDCELRVAGRGEPAYEQRLRARFDAAPIRFLGYTDTMTFLRDIDVCVVPSLWQDTLPSVVFEALGAGVPVIGARRGGIPEMVRDGFNGLLYDPLAPGALSACLARCLAEPPLLAALSSNCRVSAALFHDMPRWVEQHERLLGATIETARRSAPRGRAGRPLAGQGALACEG